jgi:hypothetical protein
MDHVLVAGDKIMAFHRDKWRPGALVKTGRKWATVALNGFSRNSKVSVDAVRPIQVTVPPASATTATTPTPRTAPRAADLIRLDEFDAYLRLIDGPKIICAIPKAYRQQAEEIVAAVTAWRRSHQDNDDQNS